MGIQQKLISPKSPWQNPFVERLVGSIRRECVFDCAMATKDRPIAAYPVTEKKCKISVVTRSVLQALLMAADVTLENISSWMKVPLDTLKMFSELFFDIRDRRDEPGFIAQLLNPDGISLSRADDNDGLLLLHAGYRFTA